MNKIRLSNLNFFELIWSLSYHISKRRKIQLLLSIILMFISSFAEIFSLASVIPFLGALSNPEKIYNVELVRNISPILNINSPEEILLPVTILFGFSAILAAILRVFNLWFNGKLSALIGSDIALTLYRKILYQPYSFHISNKSSKTIATLNTNVTTLIGVLNSLLLMISSGIILLSLLLTIIIIDGKVAIISILLFGSIYLIIAKFNNKRLLNNSRKLVLLNQESIRVIQEGLGSIRDVILNRSQNIYLKAFYNSDHPLRYLNAESNFLGSFPRYMMEAIGICLIGGISYGLTNYKGGISNSLPLLGVLALGAQRILPALQITYGAWAAIKAGRFAVEMILDLLYIKTPKTIYYKNIKPLEFKNNITFKDVSFSYKSNGVKVIKNASFKIDKGEKIGIIGTTGSGKSTLIDLLMGLLKPSNGSILIDDIDINKGITPELMLSWQDNIAHVPQTIYLTDSSIADNITFGYDKEIIDLTSIKLAAKKAHLINFIDSLPDKFYTQVGERGAKLSGGQRQRIGIARAMHKKAKVLIFDEATSSLDSKTELSIIDTIYKLDKELTIIMISHRSSTLMQCDRIIEVKDGTINSIGAPKQILT